MLDLKTTISTIKRIFGYIPEDVGTDLRGPLNRHQRKVKVPRVLNESPFGPGNNRAERRAQKHAKAPHG